MILVNNNIAGDVLDGIGFALGRIATTHLGKTDATVRRYRPVRL